jgi:hypothetical protein
LDSSAIRVVAAEMLGLNLTTTEAESLIAPLAGLRNLVRAIETVPLPYTAEPFVSPRSGDDWLENWPEP